MDGVRDYGDVKTTSWIVGPVPADSPDSIALLRLYLAEMISRYRGRPETEEEIDAEIAAGGTASEALDVVVLARHEGRPAGCAGLRMITPELVELKRVFIAPQFRGLGGGAALLAEVEAQARSLGANAIRLDTRADLVEARGLYAKHGYAEITAYAADRPYADHWFEKLLS